MNETELYRIEQRARAVLADHCTVLLYTEHCRICFTRWPCGRRVDAEDTLRLLEWIKTLREKDDGQKS